jgi:hypothetical protein
MPDDRGELDDKASFGRSSRASANQKAMTGRAYGSCSLWCRLLDVPVNRQTQTRLVSALPPGRGGCSIYDQRPQMCLGRRPPARLTGFSACGSAGSGKNAPAVEGLPCAGACCERGRRQRHVGHGAVMFAVGPLGNRTAAEVKIGVTRIAAWPAAGLWGKRADLCGGGQAWAGELGVRQGGLFRRRLDAEGGGRAALGAAVCAGGDRDGGLLDLGNRYRPRGQQAEHNADPAGDAAIADLPASDASRADAEQLGDAVLGDAERTEGRTEFSCGHWRVACLRVNGHNARVAAGSAGVACDVIGEEALPARPFPAPGA